MKTKNIIRISIALVLAGMLTSCSSTYQTASTFGKRKYLKGNFNDNAGSAEKVAATNSATPSSTATPVVSSVPVKEATQQVVNQNGNIAAVAKAPVKQSFALPVKKTNASTVFNLTAPLKATVPGFVVSNYFPDNLTNVSSHSSSSDKGGVFDFQHHLVRTILFIIFAVLIIGLIILLISLGATPTVTVGD